MKSKLEFDLPEDRDAFYCAVNGAAFRSVITGVFEMIRTKYKYEDQETVSIDELREFLVASLNEYGIDTEEK